MDSFFRGVSGPLGSRGGRAAALPGREEVLPGRKEGMLRGWDGSTTQVKVVMRRFESECRDASAIDHKDC